MCLCVCVLSKFSNIFSSGTTEPIAVKFHMEPPWDGTTNVCSNGPGHMTAMSICNKHTKNLLFRNQKADDLETWYAVLGAHVLSNVFK